MAVLGVTLLGSAAAFYFIAPIFVREPRFSGYPTLGYMPTRTPKAPTQTPLPTEVVTDTATPTSQASSLDFSPSALLAGGDFYPIAHSGSGEAAIYKADENEWVLVLRDFEVEDGPDLHVYLAVQDPVPNQEGSPLPEAVDLGALKQITGDQRYDLPQGIQLEDYRSVVIWCVPYNVPFIAAPLY